MNEAIKTTNKEAAKLLSETADYLKMDDVAFKPQAYERAAEAVEQLSKSLTETYETGGVKALREISGVGASIAEKLEELVKTGHIKYYDELKKKIPVDLNALKLIDGIGIKSIKTLYRELDIKSVPELERAAKQKKIREIEGFGEKTEEKILESVAFHKSRGNRFLLHDALEEARKIENALRELTCVKEVVIAGSIRRRKETIGDADILVVSKKPEKVTEFFLKMPSVEHVYGTGETKTMVRIRGGMDVDLRIVEADAFGAALNYFTGSRDHNIALRKRAQAVKLKLNEYGLFSGSKKVAGKNEKEVYEKLGLAYIEPELREMHDEIELAQDKFETKKQMPILIKYSALKGDLQTQSNWTDGRDTILELAQEAKKRGLSYIAITDHTKRLAMTNGLDARRLRLQMAEIDRLNKNLTGITILKGTECDILKDGALDLPDDVLAELDVVGVSVHSLFNLPRAQQTERIIKALNHPSVDILFHPTGRIVGKRDSYSVDMDAVIKTAKATGTILEVNGSSRLDMSGELTRRALKGGAKIVISSDAHKIEHFDFLEYGIAMARRGGARPKDVINTRALAKMREMLKRNN